jgi:hypothetical protein
MPPEFRRIHHAAANVAVVCLFLLAIAHSPLARAAETPGLTTWDGRHSIDTIRATVVYFVPSDRQPLPDWRERVEWLCERVRRFHHREFAGRSRLVTTIHPEPFRSAASTAALRVGDGDATFFRTLSEVDRTIDVGRDPDGAFPVLLVLSDINWRPLDDFSRQSPAGQGWKFDGALADGGLHVPGAAAGGSRAVYLADRKRGWGLVSGDGWRVPCRGSDCVVYHEGIGHAIGLPHPEPADGSVMSVGQYRSALAQSWVEAGQKKQLGFTADADAPAADPVFDTFTAAPEPAVPRPGESVALRLSPLDLIPPGLRVEVQTSLRGPWTSVPVDAEALRKGLVSLGRFDRPCGVGWRVTGPMPKIDIEAGDDARRGPGDGPSAATAWGYFQVRLTPEVPPPPVDVDPTDRPAATPPGPAAAGVDLLALVDPRRDRVAGEWTEHEVDGRRELLASKAFGARIELPYAPPEAYRLTLIVEPLDEPNGLTIGLRSGEHRFLALLGFGDAGRRVSALENIDGRNVADNPTRIDGDVFRKNLPAEIVVNVGPAGVTVTVDGRPWIDWEGKPERLSLSDYWQTPRKEALFLGAYDCRYRILRATLEPLAGAGRSLVDGGVEER